MNDDEAPRRWGPATVVAYLVLLGFVACALSVYQPIRVTGNSMRPALVSGDLVVVRKSAAVGTGDVALLAQPGRGAVLHRAVDAGPGGALVTKGDANRVVDRDLAIPDHVRGRVVAVIPAGKLVERWRSR